MPRVKRSAWSLEACDIASTVLYRAGQRQSYGPFGEGQAYGAAGYTGQYQEPCTGYALGNGRRLYRPSLRRFCQPDTLSPFQRGGLNAYVYCGAEPVNRVDPSGAFFQWLSGLLGAATSTVFLSSVVNKTASTIVDIATGAVSLSPGRLARLESVGTFYGASAGLVANSASLAAGGSSLVSLSSVSGMVASSTYSLSGAGPAIRAGLDWTEKARRAGFSKARVLMATVDELSGARMLTGRGYPRLQGVVDIEQGLPGRYSVSVIETNV